MSYCKFLQSFHCSWSLILVEGEKKSRNKLRIQGIPSLGYKGGLTQRSRPFWCAGAAKPSRDPLTTSPMLESGSAWELGQCLTQGETEPLLLSCVIFKAPSKSRNTQRAALRICLFLDSCVCGTMIYNLQILPTGTSLPEQWGPGAKQEFPQNPGKL